MARREKAASASGNYTPKFFSAHQYQTLRALCEVILPPDHESGGALEAGAPEFIDLLTSGNSEGVEAGFEALARALDREEAADA